MLLAIDAGNTNTVIALFRGERLFKAWRCKTDAARTTDEYAAWLSPLLALEKLDFTCATEAIISSVVPDANFNLQQLCRDVFKCTPLIVSPDIADIKINLDRPEEVGADRLVNVRAAIQDYGCPAIIIDFGTATTFDVVNGRGEYCGGAIAPGINLSMAALHQAAARLPKVGIKKPPAVIGTSTVTAMQAGIYWGYVGLIEGLIKRLSSEMNEKKNISVIATGGLAPLFSESIPAIEKTDGDLTLRGLSYIHSSMKKRKAA